MNERFQVRTPTVIHEVFDDEVVIVNLDSGDYFSLSKAGSDCWTYLLDGYSVSEIVEALESKYRAESNEIRTSIQRLIQELRQETLIVPHPDGSSTARITGKGDGQSIEGDRIPFPAPSLNRYSDMRDLLLIDPVHDVDESGWPEMKDDSSKPTKKE
jgi:hypothetical protein